jgi:hypothetical protein
MIRRQAIPDGLRVLPDGSWYAGELPIANSRRLKVLKQRLTFEEGGAFIVDGAQRKPLVLEGPPFHVDVVTFDEAKGEVRVRLDDGSEEVLSEPVIRMSRETGQLECEVKEGRTRAVFSAAAHDVLLEHLEQDGGDFFVLVGAKRCRVLP